ncbi:unannotated protein [freshwater metagenome]|uniref:Unannotated protein n=1 Tax=freshwater metagenome TaxID=449393 RepID=A0A6J7IE98_9ZZZZ|nr:hypothetical protein [Actinomycetota bacterium]MSZ24668.1 hypothetical protein [Actinomycetota bacterium]MSZ92615.1 hypothetical protein [Actinomycetota bacterium]
MIALIVTLACLPLLVVDMFQGSTSSATETASSTDSSLVVSSLSTEESTTTTVAVTVPAPVTTMAPATTIAPRPAQTTTTTAPRPPVTAPPVVKSDEEFLACVRLRESRNNYASVDSTGTFLGAYQIYQGGWDSVAGRISRLDLVGVPPNQASPADQDAVALAMYRFYGRAPWGGICG